MMSIFHSLALLSLPFQAGGGGSFSGGGGFSGGGDSGDGGLDVIFYFLVRLAFEAPLVGIPLLIVVAVVALKSSRKGVSVHRQRVIHRAAPKVLQQRSENWSAQIQTVDGSFDGRSFLARVQLAFVKIQESWCAQDMGPVQAFVSDGVLERFSLQFEEQRADGWRQGMVGLDVGRMGICHFEAGAHFETVTVRIAFRSDIHRLDLSTGERISGSQLSRNHFEECWSFVRRRGAQSAQGNGLVEGQCPNCGARLEMNQIAQCGSCDAFIRSGEFDWILTEITQSSEWKPEAESAVAGLGSYREKDPGLSVQLLEDQASVAFWRKCAADRLGAAEPLVRVASEEFLESYRGTIEALPGADRNYIAECAVGSVRCLGVLTASERDQVVLEILYDGCRATVDEKGARQVETARRLQRSLFVFERARGHTTDLKLTFSSARCQTCGAHDPGGTDPRCAYCDAPRTGADRWLLAEVLVERSPAAQELRRQLAEADRPSHSAPDPGQGAAPVAAGASADLVLWAAELVKSDGQVSGRERQALQGLAERAGLSAARLEEIFAEGGDGSAIPVARDTVEARTWMRSLTRLALADGTVSGPERRLLHRAARAFDIGKLEFDRILRQEERELYREARRARRRS